MFGIRIRNGMRPSRFEGTANCANGKLAGTVVLTWQSFKDGKWENHVESRGPYAEGKRNGAWTLQFEDGRVYEGPYVDGKRHGHWVERAADGSRHEGRHAEGVPEGRWVYYDSAGNAVGGGRWANGARQGPWVLTRPDDDTGWRGEGKFVDGKYDGDWIFTEASGWRAEIRLRRRRGAGPSGVHGRVWRRGVGGVRRRQAKRRVDPSKSQERTVDRPLLCGGRVGRPSRRQSGGPAPVRTGFRRSDPCRGRSESPWART